VRGDPGVELVLEANTAIGARPRRIQRLIFKGVPERPHAPGHAQTGEADLATFMVGRRRGGGARDPKLRLGVVIAPVTWWLEFPDQWGPTSPGVIAGCGWPDLALTAGATRGGAARLWAADGLIIPGARVRPAAGGVPV